jgi:hypothetical protein
MSIRPDQLDALQTDAGRRLLAAIAARDPSPAETLAAVTELRRDHDPDLVAAAMTIHALRQRAEGRFRDADRLWLTGEGLEQATGDLVADRRAARFAGCDRVADLCCGIGGDLMALARREDIGALLAVDRDPLHLAMAAVNARIANPEVDLTAIVASAEEVDLAGVDGAFLDPARRRGGKRTGAVTSPPLDWALGLADRVAKVGVTVAPGIDHALAPAGWELELTAVGSDLKEGVLWSPALATASRRAVVIDPDTGAAAELVDGDPGDVPVVAPEAGMTVFDPNPAVTRAGLVRELAASLGAAMIDPRIAFLVTGEPVATPFGRSLTIVDSLPWHERRVKARLAGLGAGPVDVRRRGLAGDVDAIARRLRGPGGHGLRPYTVLMTRHEDAPWAIIAEDAGRGGHGP